VKNRKAKGRDDTPSFSRIAERLRGKADGIREYEVVEAEPAEKPEFSMLSILLGREYQEAMKLKKRLMRRYKGKALEEVIPGSAVSNDHGNCYYIASEYTNCFQNIDLERSRRAILSNLQLLSGIGDVWEESLKSEGYQTIEHLTKHWRWQETAREFLRVLESKNLVTLQEWLWRWLPKSHPLVHYLAGLTQEEDFVIFDIETLGLFGRPIILFGLAKPTRNDITIHQYLVRDIADEPSALHEFTSHFKPGSAAITFNGRAFDMPYIVERLGYYGMNTQIRNAHFDMLHFARRAWKEKLPNCRLTTIERYLGFGREADVPSELVPEFYETYLRTQNIGPLVPIIEHNRQDLITLASIFSRLFDVWQEYGY